MDVEEFGTLQNIAFYIYYLYLYKNSVIPDVWVECRRLFMDAEEFGTRFSKPKYFCNLSFMFRLYEHFKACDRNIYCMYNIYVLFYSVQSSV